MTSQMLTGQDVGALVRRAISILVIVPIYDEEENIALLCERLFRVLRRELTGFEVIAVNDGSRDRSARELRDKAKEYHELKVIDLRRNYGQTTALMAGIDHAAGEIIVM